VGNGRFQASWPLEYSMFGGPLKWIKCLEVNGETSAWWLMKGSKLGGPSNIPCLVALKMNPMLRGQWGNILLDGPWNVPCLVAFGRKNIFFTSFHFSPHKILL
jgi:hypothetical protein